MRRRRVPPPSRHAVIAPWDMGRIAQIHEGFGKVVAYPLVVLAFPRVMVSPVVLKIERPSPGLQKTVALQGVFNPEMFVVKQEHLVLCRQNNTAAWCRSVASDSKIDFLNCVRIENSELATVDFRRTERMRAGQMFASRRKVIHQHIVCLLYTSPSPRDRTRS